jgi:hypothetical protein
MPKATNTTLRICNTFFLKTQGTRLGVMLAHTLAFLVFPDQLSNITKPESSAFTAVLPI